MLFFRYRSIHSPEALIIWFCALNMSRNQNFCTRISAGKRFHLVFDTRKSLRWFSSICFCFYFLPSSRRWRLQSSHLQESLRDSIKFRGVICYRKEPRLLIFFPLRQHRRHKSFPLWRRLLQTNCGENNFRLFMWFYSLWHYCNFFFFFFNFLPFLFTLDVLVNE